MNIVAINGSPRKNGNTAILLGKALEGAASKGAETELIQLYDLNYKGCISCFACKRKGGKSYGKCAVKDDLSEIFAKIEQADALILGSPIYFGEITGAMRSFLERLFFPYLVYDDEYSVLFPKKIKTGFIFTMNAPERMLKEIKYDMKFKGYEGILTRFFGSAKTLAATDTWQFEDYSKYETSAFDVDAKAKRRREVFPQDCQQAFDLGAELIG
ncbi:flavodoxin family protein [Acetobacterium fimetarium]|uniref:Flavodoxin family protein n=1 Tax=Acetobacterium fimetarium TaxID=52691 RepID=A0ABR6WQV0_9FIRM|nr:flavodoxin family protein [Acetobacterium fimetarium]MBC3802946.1 flavodoxin family protein [Acetobacterium fimetarium]